MISQEKTNEKAKYNKRGNPFKRYKTKEDELKKTKNYTWSFYYFVEDPITGKKIQKYKSGFRTHKAASDELVKKLSEIQNGDYVDPTKITLGEYLIDWLERRKSNLAPTTFEGYYIIIHRHIIPTLGNKSLQKLKATDIEDFYNSKRVEGARADGRDGRLSEKTLLYIHRVFSMALDNAVRKKLVARNVSKDIQDRPKNPIYQHSIYPPDQIIKLLECVGNTDMEVPVTLAAVIGLRRGEILGLRWCNVDFINNTLSIRDQLISTKLGTQRYTTKTEQSKRTIPVPLFVMEVLAKHKKNQDKIKETLGQSYKDESLVNCYNDGSPISPSYFTKKFGKTLKKHALPHIRFHDLRHSAATNMLLNLSIPTKMVSEILGHSDTSTTLRIYCKVLDNHMREVANRLQNSFQQSKSESS